MQRVNYRTFSTTKRLVLLSMNNLAKDTACIMSLSSVRYFLNNALSLVIPNLVYLSIICHNTYFVSGCSITYRREGAGRGREAGIASFYFFSSLCISLSDRSRKVGAKNRQLPNERQLSGDQLQEGPDRRIRCNRPMSTVQHLCLFSVSFSFRSPCNFSRGVKGEEAQRKGRENGKGRIRSFSSPALEQKRYRKLPILRTKWKGHVE